VVQGQIGMQMLNELPRNTLGEGPLWAEGSLYYVDIQQGRIHRHHFSAGAHDVIETSGPVGFVVLDEEDNVIAGLEDGAIFRLSFNSQDKQLIAKACRDNRRNRANDGKCDRRGRLWCGTMNRDDHAPDSGSLGRFDGGPRLTEILFPVHISNGIAWSPDDKTMYFSESTDKLWRFDYDIETGAASNRRVFVELSHDAGIPDGMTIDSEGLLYVAKWGGARVDVYRDEQGTGRLVETIPVPTALQVSSVTFGGDDLKTLFITSAAVDLSAKELASYPESGRIFSLQRTVPGLPEARFKLDRLSPRPSR
jgi:sugar lactone lactonase YvrE